MGYVISLGKEIVRKRKMILDLSKADFRKRFVGSYFGIVWMFLQPLVTVLIYWFIFGEYGMKSVPPVPNASYVVWLVPGLVPWFFYSEAMNAITGCLQEYSYLVKKVVFQVEILPIIKLTSCLIIRISISSFDYAGPLSGNGAAGIHHLDSDPLLFPGGGGFGPCHRIFYQRGECIFQRYGQYCRNLPAVWHLADANYV